MANGVVGRLQLPNLKRRMPEAHEMMKPVFVFFTLALIANLATAQPVVPAPVLPESLKWFSPPGNALLRAAWVIGTERQAGTYLLRVVLAKGGKIAPHTHPDTRNSTVLSGTLYVGFGNTVDESKVVAIPAGGVYVAPANVPHYLWAKDGDVIYQEGGTGPTATSFAKP